MVSEQGRGPTYDPEPRTCAPSGRCGRPDAGLGWAMTGRGADLIEQVCGGADHPLAPVLRAWCLASRPFLSFAGAHASKLRKKVRLAAGETWDEELADVLAELAVAAWLLQGRQLTLIYEPPHPAGQRGPDFQAVFRGHSTLYVEVTRLRPAATPDADLAALKLARVLCDKVGQCLPGAMNLLVVVEPPELPSSDPIPAALTLVHRSLQHGSPPSPGLPPGRARSYLRQCHRLSGVLLCAFPDSRAPQIRRLWLNPQARHPLPPALIRSLERP